MSASSRRGRRIVLSISPRDSYKRASESEDDIPRNEPADSRLQNALVTPLDPDQSLFNFIDFTNPVPDTSMESVVPKKVKARWKDRVCLAMVSCASSAALSASISVNGLLIFKNRERIKG